MGRPKKETSKLTDLGQIGEKVLKRTLQDIDAELLLARKESRDPKFSLTDLMKVIDRVQKFEFINLKLKEGEDDGGFFGSQPEGANDDEQD